MALTILISIHRPCLGYFHISSENQSDPWSGDIIFVDCIYGVIFLCYGGATLLTLGNLVVC